MHINVLKKPECVYALCPICTCICKASRLYAYSLSPHHFLVYVGPGLFMFYELRWEAVGDTKGKLSLRSRYRRTPGVSVVV